MIVSFFYGLMITVSIMFLGIRLKNWMAGHAKYYPFALSVFYGCFSIAIMMQQFKAYGMMFDLRSVPILFVSFRHGWKIGAASLLLPAVYRYFLGGESVWQGILLGFLIPWLLGSLINTARDEEYPYHRVRFKPLLGLVLAIYVAEWIVGVITLDLSFTAWLEISVFKLLFSLLSIIAIMLMVNDDTDNWSMKRKLLYMSSHDSLTLISNFRSFKERADRIVTGIQPFSIVMIDIDYFKKYNDTHGHLAGDTVLRSIAKVFASCTDEDDLVARYGGEEFVLLLRGSLHDRVLPLAERIRQEVENYPFEGRETQPDGKITVSIGVCGRNGETTLREMLGKADQALYQSKNNGRNRVTVYGGN